MNECKHGYTGHCDLCAHEDREHDAAMAAQAAAGDDDLAALRKDAERYRKLRAALGPGRHSMMTPRITAPVEPGQTYTPEGLNAALDALPAVGDA
jgi:hypothetical protein